MSKFIELQKGIKTETGKSLSKPKNRDQIEDSVQISPSIADTPQGITPENAKNISNKSKSKMV